MLSHAPGVAPARVPARRRLHCSASGVAADGAADPAFQALARRAGCVSPFGSAALQLRAGSLGRGLFAARNLSPGEPLLQVPLALCLAAERAAAVAVPGAPWASLTAGAVPGWPRLQTPGEAYPLPWDVRLSLCLLDAAAGEGGVGDAAALWRDYAQLLPPPGTLACPLCLPADALRLAGQPRLEADWVAEAARLAALFPALPAAELLYGVALARSRAFGVSDTFLIVPFIDMCNTAFAAGAVNATASLRVAAGRDAAAAALEADGTFELAAGPAGVRAGDEVIISYGAGGTGNASLLAKYGFVRESNPNDRLACLAGLAVAGLDAAALERAAAAATEARGGRWLRERSTAGQLQAALASLPCRAVPPPRGAPPRRPAEERDDVATLRAAVAEALAATPDDAAADAAELARLRSAGAPAAPLLQLRMEHRSLLQRAAWLLDAYDAALPHD